MGKSNTPTFRVEYTSMTLVTGRKHANVVSWDVQQDGPANEQSLRGFVRSMEQSTREGGVNAHLGAELIVAARLVRQSSGQTVARFKRGTSFSFEVI
jgi:hypothetical protein